MSNTGDVAVQITKAPRPALRRWGYINEDALFARQNGNPTCGYIDGNSGSAVTCATDYYCASFSSTSNTIVGNFVCCPSSSTSGCPVTLGCVPYTDPSNLNPGTTYSFNSQTLYCPSDQGNCHTYRSSAGEGTTYDNYLCSSDAPWTYTIFPMPRATVVTTATAEGTTEETTVTVTPSDSSVTDGPSAPPLNPTNQTSSSPISPGSTPASIPASTISSTMSSTASATGSPTPVGAIAGGVVGGVAALALIGVAIGVLVRRKRKHRVEAMREVSQYPGRTY